MRTDRALKCKNLELIERASRDEISALQLSRLRWSVRHTL